MQINDKRSQHIRIKNYPDILTIDEMCQMLGISTKTGYRFLRNGTIKAFKIGRSYRIPKIHVLTYLQMGIKPGIQPVATSLQTKMRSL